LFHHLLSNVTIRMSRLMVATQQEKGKCNDMQTLYKTMVLL
jgi:hypothetical protein